MSTSRYPFDQSMECSIQHALDSCLNLNAHRHALVDSTRIATWNSRALYAGSFTDSQQYIGRSLDLSLICMALAAQAASLHTEANLDVISSVRF